MVGVDEGVIVGILIEIGVLGISFGIGGEEVPQLGVIEAVAEVNEVVKSSFRLVMPGLSKVPISMPFECSQSPSHWFLNHSNNHRK